MWPHGPMYPANVTDISCDLLSSLIHAASSAVNLQCVFDMTVSEHLTASLNRKSAAAIASLVLSSPPGPGPIMHAQHVCDGVLVQQLDILSSNAQAWEGEVSVCHISYSMRLKLVEKRKKKHFRAGCSCLRSADWLT